MNSGDRVQEIIIIKRSSEDDEGQHGGAWKIAFADFMTAMMALFLVLWLINAANEETKKAVASYFNPVKLVDRNRSVKGLHDAEGVQEIEVKTPNQQFPDEKPQSDVSDKKSTTDSQYFADPFSVLNEIASHKAPGELRYIEEEGGRNGNNAINDAQGGEAFMDPFSPNFWNEEVRPSNDKGQLSGRYETFGEKDDVTAQNSMTSGNDANGETQDIRTGAQMAVNDAGTDTATTQNVKVDRIAVAVNDAKAASAMKTETTSDAVTETASIGDNAGAGGGTAEMAAQDAAPEKSAMQEEKPSPEQAAMIEKAAATQVAAEDMRGKITEKLAEAFGENSRMLGELTVTPSGNEVLISLTDALDISMFEVGSAVPSHDLVIALEKIGGVLAAQKGGIRIHGHTDARPFRSKDYDNWRLSASRAQSAYYMILRGGLEETRVREISGFADRQLLDPAEPLSPKNRRIEVLVEVDAG